MNVAINDKIVRTTTGSMWPPILFLIYINDITQEVHGKIKPFANDTTVDIVVQNAYEAVEN